MKWLNYISVMFLSAVFMLSATGIVLFQSHCVCTGSDHVSIYVSPETCEDNFHAHHVHLKGGEEVPSSEEHCHECTSHTKECGCKNFSVSFLKLKNEVVFEKVRTKSNLAVAAKLPDIFINLLKDVDNNPEETEIRYIEPPSLLTSIDFLIFINQLKIPYTA